MGGFFVARSIPSEGAISSHTPGSLGGRSFCPENDMVDLIFSTDEANIIKGIPLFIFSQDDRLVWEDNSGAYSVRSGYKLLLQPSIWSQLIVNFLKQI